MVVTNTLLIQINEVPMLHDSLSYIHLAATLFNVINYAIINKV
jgi:hypothetical protein